VLLVVCAVIGPWASALVDPAILKGDIIPFVWVFFSVLLSSILLPPTFTMVLATLQAGALTLVYVLTTTPGSLVNWPSLLSFFIASSVMAVLASVITRRDAEQIDNQTDMLLASETRLREQSVRDHLTGLFNRRYLEETLEREIDRMTRETRPLGLIMLDIDHFKDFNDSLGHAAGDALLQSLGGLLLDSVRGSDVACRCGGEEFVLVLPDVSAAVTMERAERLCADIERLRVEYGGEQLGTITMSVGVAAFPEHGATGDDVMKAADTAMYEAKARGRNRVVMAEVRASA
jgi:diguanylate cyclase (GGDEF)-like protein